MSLSSNKLPVSPVFDRELLATDGFIDCLTEAQESALAEARRDLGSLIAHQRWNDVLLLRYLRASHFQLEQACTAVKETLKFREERKLDFPLRLSADCEYSFQKQDDAAERAIPTRGFMKRNYPHGYHKTDRKGRPIYIERVGRIRTKKLLETLPLDKILAYFCFEAEYHDTHRIPAASLARGALVEQDVVIVDLNGVSWAHVTNAQILRTFKGIALQQEQHFPEGSIVFFIVNAPSAFALAWAAVKPMLSARTVAKMQVFREGNPAAREKLLEFVAPENLPAFLGGECRCDGTEDGCLYSDAGPWSDPAICQQLSDNAYWKVLNKFAAEARRKRPTEAAVAGGNNKADGTHQQSESKPCDDTASATEVASQPPLQWLLSYILGQDSLDGESTSTAASSQGAVEDQLLTPARALDSSLQPLDPEVGEKWEFKDEQTFKAMVLQHVESLWLPRPGIDEDEDGQAACTGEPTRAAPTATSPKPEQPPLSHSDAVENFMRTRLDRFSSWITCCSREADKLENDQPRWVQGQRGESIPLGAHAGFASSADSGVATGTVRMVPACTASDAIGSGVESSLPLNCSTRSVSGVRTRRLSRPSIEDAFMDAS